MSARCPCGAPAKVKYCSREHAGRYGGTKPKAQPSKICEVCEGEYTRDPHSRWADWEKRRACSVACENRRMLRGRAVGDGAGRDSGVKSRVVDNTPRRVAERRVSDLRGAEVQEGPVWRPAGWAAVPGEREVS